MNVNNKTYLFSFIENFRHREHLFRYFLSLQPKNYTNFEKLGLENLET